MVKEKRIVFEIKDLRRIGLRCGKCGGEISMSFKTFDEIPHRCPVCRHEWRVRHDKHHVIGDIIDLLGRHVDEPTDSTVQFFMELDGEDVSEA